MKVTVEEPPEKNGHVIVTPELIPGVDYSLNVQDLKLARFISDLKRREWKRLELVGHRNQYFCIKIAGKIAPNDQLSEKNRDKP